MSAADEAPVLILVRDLIFATKIRGTAEALGVASRPLREPDKLKGLTGRLLIVDLNLPGAVEAAADWRRTTSMPVVGFVSHVDAETIRHAREAGLDRVLPRSRFVDELPDLLRSSGIP